MNFPSPHQAIISVTGNTFGVGDELARDILYALGNAGNDGGEIHRMTAATPIH